jgi:hypothetical protein
MKEEDTTKKENEFKLVPLTDDQHEISLAGKATTDLPFFYLTKRKERLSQPIVFEGTDSEGRPMRWVATPNSAIGSPAIDAHEAWTRLIKPTWEAYRTPDDRLPNILPLGGVRQCLRVVGWGAGGWEARRLLAALNQIGATWCAADFWIPTHQKSADGKPTFRAIKGNFSRLTIFAIGSKHLTDDELRDGKFSFDFDLEDTIYLQFHPLEVAIQESQPQRYLDNLYMFSVGPAARRWYELMAAKVFGVVKNGGVYCEVLYSWYVKHHHTLKRRTTRRRVTQQINEIVREHLNSKFISKVEFRAIKETGKEIDFLIRFYPGRAAKESIARVLSSIHKKRLPAGEPRRLSRRRNLLDDAAVFTAEASEEREEQSRPESPAMSPIADTPFLEDLTQRGIFRAQAVKLISPIPSQQRERVGDYIDYWDNIPSDKRGPGLLYSLIQNSDPLPASFETRGQRKMRREAEERHQRIRSVKERLTAAYAEHHRNAIDNFIIADLGAEEFERRVDARKTELSAQGGLWEQMSPALADNMARSALRAEIADNLAIISFEDFRQREIPRLLADFELSPADFGLPALATTPDDATSVPPNALYDPPSNVSPKDGETPYFIGSLFTQGNIDAYSPTCDQ